MADLNSVIDAQISDNTTGKITPAVLRGVLHQVVGRGPNEAPSLLKEVLCMTRAEAPALYGGTTFQDLDYLTCCAGTIVQVEFYRATPTSPVVHNQKLVAVYDGRPTPAGTIYRTGAFAPGDTAPGKFVPVESAEAAGTLPYAAGDAGITAAGIERKYDAGDGKGIQFYQSAKALPAPVPAPTGASDTNWTIISPPLSPYLLPAPNVRLSAAKSVIYLTQQEAAAAGRSGVATLDQLDPLSCCTGTVAYIDLPPYGTSKWRVLVYDDRPAGSPGQLLAYFDGAGTRNYNLSGTGLATLRWVEQGSTEEVVASLRRYDAGIANWALDETMKINLGGTDAFFSANIAGGPLPAPTVAGTSTANWKAATVSGTNTSVALSQRLTLAQAQAINHDQVVAGVLYLIDFGPDQAGYTQTISLLGVSDNSFSIRGILEANGVQTGVRANVDSGVFGEEASYNTLIVTDVSAAKRAAVVSAVANSIANGRLASALDSAGLAPGDGLAGLDYVAREFIDLTGSAGYLYKCYLDVNGQVVWVRLKIQ